MSTPLLPTVTEVGLRALWRQTGDGVSAQITHVALGDAGYTPHQGMTGLRAERVRYPVAAGRRLGARQVHITALADGDADFWVREIAFLLADGTPLAIWSHPSQPLAYKPPGTDLLLAYDLTLSAVPADSVTVVATAAGPGLSMAPELAALATAQIDAMRRDLSHDDSLRAHQQRLADSEQRLSEHAQRLAGGDRGLLSLDAREQQHHAAQQQRGDELTELATAHAAALIDLQRTVLQHTVFNPQEG